MRRSAKGESRMSSSEQTSSPARAASPSRSTASASLAALAKAEPPAAHDVNLSNLRMPTPAEEAPRRSKPMGIRELSKQESQHKILIAAREIFAEHGYQEATLRQIATKAGLTVGALFNHVKDKRDLIYLIFNEEVDKIVETAFASPRAYQSLSAKILSVTEHYIRMFGSEPVLSRTLLTEIVALSPGLHLNRYLITRARLVDGIERIVAEAQVTGEIGSTEASEIIARHIFFVFSASLRLWLASSARPEWRDGQRDFERHLNLLIRGLSEKGDSKSVEAKRGLRLASRNDAVM